MKDSQLLKSPARRRLAKGAMAVPAVLATIASKNALASPIYACTVSGALSGNMSPNRVTGSCVTKSRSVWTAHYAESGNNQIKNVPDWLGVTINGSTDQLTRHQVFTTINGQTVAFAYNQDLTRSALAVFCNIEDQGAQYHIDENDCRELFLTAVNGGVLTRSDVGGSLDAGGCANLLQSLSGDII